MFATRVLESMAAKGHSRRFGGPCRMSALPPIATEKRTSIYVGDGSGSRARRAALRRTSHCWPATAKSCFTRLNDRFGPGRDAQLAEYEGHVISHRTLANAQVRADGRIVEALGDQL